MGRVLVLGGNGLCGAEAVLELTALGHEVVTLNRGKCYWDNNERLRGAVTRHVKCDRDALAKASRSGRKEKWPREVRAPNAFDAVVDFSSYTRRDTLSALREFAPRVDLYVYISTDSVYEVCAPAASLNHRMDDVSGASVGQPAGAAWRGSVEEDAMRPPPHSEERRRLRRADRYGHGKLVSEREIERAAVAYPSMKYVILRLADVLGARDNTGRWIELIMWVIAAHVAPDIVPGVHVSDDVATRPISLVAATDVARVIAAVVTSHVPRVLGNAFNLAFDEPILLRDLIGLIAAEVIAPDAEPRVLEVRTEAGLTLFPSVTRGPVCTDKARRLLEWAPESISAAVHSACAFYLTAIASGSPEARKAVAELVDDLDLGDCEDALWHKVRNHAQTRA